VIRENYLRMTKMALMKTGPPRLIPKISNQAKLRRSRSTLHARTGKRMQPNIATVSKAGPPGFKTLNFTFSGNIVSNFIARGAMQRDLKISKACKLMLSMPTALRNCRY
jgi:hypothetical protein